jgi:diguanylate cyclase (GGDEF)-like protein
VSELSESNIAVPESVSLLLVGEDDVSAKRVLEVLSRPEGIRFDVTRVLHVDDALSRLQIESESFDLLLLDLSLDESGALGSLLRARVVSHLVPIVVLSYERDETVALKAARLGAQDYLTKGEVTAPLMTRTLLHAIERHRMLRDLTEAKQRQHFLATRDSLTELPNRYSFLAELQTALAGAERSGKKLAVMFFDLDGFKAVNDNLGHPIGDELLIDVASRLRGAIRRSDLVARIGGDEFLAALRSVSSEKSVMRVADHIRREIERPYHLGGYECWISASVGVSIFPDDGADADGIIRCADRALYEAKSSGKNRVCLFDSELNKKAAERFDLVNGLREAIRSGQLVLAFQPQIDVRTMEIVGVETLVRWEHPVRGLVPPSEFIGVAEEAGLMVALGEWVLRTACAAASEWTLLENARVAVNISGRQLEEENFPDRVKTILAETGLPAERLEVELTESLVASDAVLEGLARLRGMGVRAAIDDFGTGYSSLRLLRRLPADMLKIDRSFVRGAAQTEQDAVILESIIRMAQGLGLDVMAEGVETLAEMDSLRDRGCSLMQGYLFSRPIPKLQLEASLESKDAQWRMPIERPDGWSAPVHRTTTGDADAPSEEPEDNEADFPAFKDSPLPGPRSRR